MKHFFIVGAQKAGTTALWQYLKDHPSLNFPIHKESNYFLSQDQQKKGWKNHLSTFYSRSGNEIYTASASPYYMCYPMAAKAIHSFDPESKIIMILRDPIDRAISHYNMMKRTGFENRTLEKALNDLICFDDSYVYSIDNLDSVSEKDDCNHYLAYGKYNKILNLYLDYFLNYQSFLCLNL